ncbi:MAG TPA: two-component regulator propeller domain-containing protein [Puia sp.]|nr:two-component regulator propeller domain-containing protein [Puia sp.]
MRQTSTILSLFPPRPWLILLLISLLSLDLSAQYDKYRFSRLDISRGLSHNEVNCIFKDEKGFMWLGTMSGLNRYDGYSFKVFKHDLRDSSSINDDLIVRILQGPGHKLWISTGKGFTIYDPMTEKFDRNPQRFLHSIHIDADSITDIQKDKQDNYWFVATGKGGGLYKYDAPHRSTQYFLHKEGDSATPHSNQVRAIAANTIGDWWIIYDDGLLEKMDGRTNKIVYGSAVLQKNFPHEPPDYHLYVDAQNDCWLYIAGKTDGIVYFNPSSGNCTRIRKEAGAQGLNNNLVTGIVQDDKGLMWIGTDHGGINLLDKKDFSIRYLLAREDDDKSLGQNSIVTLYKDNTGIVWVGTFKKGASYYHEDILKFPLYRHQPSNPNSLPYDDVNRFVEDEKGNLWIGTNGGGLIYFNRAAGKYTVYTHNPADPGSLSNDVIVSLCIDHEQHLWIGTYYGGLDYYDGRTFRHYRHNESDSNSIGDDRIWEIKEDSRGRLWVGTLAAGLDLFDRKRNAFIHYHPNAPVPSDGSAISSSVRSGYISELMEDKEGNLWVGTARGIDVLETATGRFRHYSNVDNNAASLSNNNVISILEDSRGLIWVGTREGLDLFDRKTRSFTTFRTGEGLPDNTILTILEDNSHNLWLSTPNGLSNMIVSTDSTAGDYPPAGLHSYSGYSWRVKNYDESHGLQGREFNENAALKTREGEVIFGGASGFNIFDPQRLRTGTRNPELILTDLQVFNKSIGIGEKLNGHIVLPRSITESREITLRYNENVFSIGFAVLDFLNAEKVKYAYILEGFNKDWLVSDDKTRKAVYTNLDPGSYTFKVRTANDDGTWNARVLELGITILPPFWKTPLAYIAYVLLFAGILVLARKMILERAHRRFALEQERQEAQRLHDLDMMKIRFFTNVSHEFRTPLSMILTPLDKIIKNTDNPGQKAQFHLIHRNARRLLNMVNQLLDFRKLEVQELRLNAGKGDIVKFIKELSFSFADIAGKKNIDFAFTTTIPALYTSFDQDKLERIIFNLLSNAFKFTHEHGRVSVTVDWLPPAPGDPITPVTPALAPFPTTSTVTPAITTAMPRLLQLTVKDTGIGMEKDKQEKIFERFFQNDIPGSMVNQGSGIGLSITKEFVKLHNGSIRVESEPGQGSSFIILLPLANLGPIPNPASADFHIPGDPSDLSIAGDSSSASASTTSAATDLTATVKKDPRSQASAAKRLSILLVEDNEDFRFYLKDNLKEFFTIVEASNGKSGWQKTLATHPALVVSDISMPEMNGIDLCRKIRSDRRTSFIPVILLTALIGEEQQLKGLETGANDYMTKPFNFEILLSKIRNLLIQQEKTRKTYQKQVEASPANVGVETPDEKFIRQALDLVEKNIANTEFSVEEMSRELFLSRVALYKKLFHLTGKTPIEFIRSIRLKRAAQLLEKSQFTVAEIAYEVGFNNPKYFSRYFKAEFGVLPSAYQRSANKP